jgi:hypothetical protein
MTLGSVMTVTGILIGNMPMFAAAMTITVASPLLESSYNYYKNNTHKFDFIKNKFTGLRGEK